MSIKSQLKAFVADEKGTETVEWGIMAGLIVAGLVALIGGIGNWIGGKFEQLSTDLGIATQPPVQ